MRWPSSSGPDALLALSRLLVLFLVPASGTQVAGAPTPAPARGAARTTGAPKRAVPVHAKPAKRRVTTRYLSVKVATKRGKPQILSVVQARFAKPTPIMSYWGPFELRLHAGNRLIDAIRFSFPLTLPAGAQSPANSRIDRHVARGLSATTTVRVPYHEAATHLTLRNITEGRDVHFPLRGSSATGPTRFSGPTRTVSFGKGKSTGVRERRPTQKEPSKRKRPDGS